MRSQFDVDFRALQSNPHIFLEQVTDKKSLREFIHLPLRLYRHDPRWVPPIYADEWKLHDGKFNAALNCSEVTRVIARRDGRAVGRVMGIINRRYNEQTGAATARFFQLDCVDDQEVVHALLRFVEEWAKALGMSEVIGPFGFSDKDPQGLQIEGFEYRPIIAAPSNPSYLPPRVEAEGYTQHFDCVSLKIPIEQEPDPLLEKIYQRIIRRGELKLVEFKKKRELQPFILPTLRLVNETYGELFGFEILSEEEMKRLAKQYLPVLDPAFLKVVQSKDNELVGFIIAIPDMSEGLQRAKGRLFPFGFLQVLAAMKKTRQLNLVLGAVKPGFRSRGVTVVLGRSLTKSAFERGFEFFDSHLVLESNRLMCAEYEKRGGQIFKRFRVFRKTIR